MEGRVYPDNIFLACCCYVFLPIIGLIKGVIIVGPIILLSIFGCTGIAIILLPHDIFLTYKALCKTSLIGINLKIMGMLLLPVALSVWPIVALFESCIIGFIYGLFFPILITLNTDCNLIYGGIADTFKETFDFIGEFWKFNYENYFNYLYKFGNEDCDEPFDINIIQIIIGLILAGYGLTVGVIILIFMWIIKLFPSIYHMYNEMFKYYCNFKCYEILMYSIFYLIAIILIPVSGVLAILFYIGYGFYGGVLCAIEGYQYNIGRGIISIWATIRNCDILTNYLIFETKYSCFPDCSQTCKIKKESKHKLIKNAEGDINQHENEKEKENAEKNKTENEDKNPINNEENIIVNEENSNLIKVEPEIEKENLAKNEEDSEIEEKL